MTSIIVLGLASEYFYSFKTFSYRHIFYNKPGHLLTEGKLILSFQESLYNFRDE